jgi:hypothetical protein
MKALVGSSSRVDIFWKFSRLTLIVQSALFPSPSVTVFGADLPSMNTLPCSPKSIFKVPPRPELGPITLPICSMIFCTCSVATLPFFPRRGARRIEVNSGRLYMGVCRSARNGGRGAVSGRGETQ